MNKTMSKIADAVRSRKSMRNGNYAVLRNDTDDYTSVWYHDTVVVAIFNPSNKAYLGNDGWYTPTTKNVMNAALEGAGIPAYVFQKNYEWFVQHHRETIPYHNGMEITA